MVRERIESSQYLKFSFGYLSVPIQKMGNKNPRNR